MKKILIILIVFAFTKLAMAEDIKQISKHFIVIGCDGMSPDGIRNAVTPNMDEMIKNGSFTLKARGVLPTRNKLDNIICSRAKLF